MRKKFQLCVHLVCNGVEDTVKDRFDYFDTDYPEKVTKHQNFIFSSLLTHVKCVRPHRFAEAHNTPNLLMTALRFIEINFPQVSQEEEFLDLPKEQLVKFISSEYIHIDTEFQVIMINE